MRKNITNQEALSVIVGKRLSIWRRAANMLVIHFGNIERGENKSWGEIAIHVQCPWRVLSDGAMFTGLGDLYHPAHETEDFDWGKWWADGSWPDNLMEFQMRQVLKGTDTATRSLENVTKALVVEKVTASSVGDAAIYLSGGFTIEFFPNCVEGEHWRILDRGRKKQFVVENERKAPANNTSEHIP